MMIPKQAQFQMLDGKTANATGDLQLNFIRACNDEMSVAVLGNTETTTSSSSSGYAQAKEQGKQQLDITKADISFVENMLNSSKFIAILKSYGYPVSDGGAFEFEQEIDLEALKQRLEIDREVSAKVPISDDYWYDTYGIPKPDNYNDIKLLQDDQRRKAEDNALELGEENGKETKSLLASLTDFFVPAPPTRGGANVKRWRL